MISCGNELFFIIDLGIKSVEIFYQHVASEWNVGLNILWILRWDLGVEFVPFLVKGLSIFFVLLHCVDFLLLCVHLESLIECKRINLFQNCLESNQWFLENLVPVILSKINDDWNKHWEGLLFVGLKDVQEVVVLEEAHSSVSYLKMDATNASNYSLEQLRDQVLDFIDFTHFENLLQLGQEESLFDAVCKWPISKETFEERNSECSIFRQEEHWASEELFIELWTCLYFMERDNDILEENDVFIS